MDEWENFVHAYRAELIAEKLSQEIRLQRLQERLKRIVLRNRINSPRIIRKIALIYAQIKDTFETIETHITLIAETEDGTLDYRQMQ